MIVNNINNKNKNKSLYKFQPKFDATMAILMVILMFVIGVSIGAYEYQLKIQAHAITSISMGKLTTGTVLGNPTIINVRLSNTCLAMIKNNDTSECPTYKKILPFDNSNKMLSGRFVTDKNGFFHRLVPNTLYHYQMYLSSQTIVLLDPDPRAMEYGKNITIVPNGTLNYALTDDAMSLSSTKGTGDNIVSLNYINRTEYHQRSVASDCQSAEIEYSYFLLNDTINYLKSNCKITHFKEATIIPMKLKPADIKNSVTLKYNNWVKTEAIPISKKNCLKNYCPVTDNIWKK